MILRGWMQAKPEKKNHVEQLDLSDLTPQERISLLNAIFEARAILLTEGYSVRIGTRRSDNVYGQLPAGLSQLPPSSGV
jgi:hypothetical protein